MAPGPALSDTPLPSQLGSSLVGRNLDDGVMKPPMLPSLTATPTYQLQHSWMVKQQVKRERARLGEKVSEQPATTILCVFFCLRIYIGLCLAEKMRYVDLVVALNV